MIGYSDRVKNFTDMTEDQNREWESEIVGLDVLLQRKDTCL